MSESSFGTQGDWYAVGTLLTQMAFLLAAVWFARNFLKTIRVFQEQVGALLKLSITAAPGEPTAVTQVATRPVAAEASSYRYLVPGEAQAGSVAGTNGGLSRFEANAYRPMRSEPVAEAAASRQDIPDSSTGTSIGPWRRVGAWLQTPMSTQRVVPAGPWRRVANWLQTPVGS